MMDAMHNPKITCSFVYRIGDLHKNGAPDFSMLHAKRPASRHIPDLTVAHPARMDAKPKSKLQKNTGDIFKDAFLFSTFNDPGDGGGIDIPLVGRTSLNVDLNGCYEPSGHTTSTGDADSCGQSPDLDMSLSLTFDLK